MSPAVRTRVAVTGAAGQVGRALLRQARVEDLEVIGFDRSQLDIGDAAGVMRALDQLRPDFVVNCAAYTAVDRAEAEEEKAFEVNAEAPAVLARWCEQSAAALIHMSTDYVFSGAAGPAWREQDPIAPLNAYGRSKAAGEEAVRAATGRHVILRTSWVYAPWGHNFVRTILRLAGEREEIVIVDDQWGRPTAACDIAEAVLRIVRRAREPAPPFGTFHFANSGATTWCRFAEAVLDQAAESLPRRPRVKAIASSDYPTPARRPLNSILDTRIYESTFGTVPRPWQAALKDAVDALRTGSSAAGGG